MTHRPLVLERIETGFLSPPPPPPRLDLQSADAPSASGAEADRDRLVLPAHPFERIEHGFGDESGKRPDQFIKPEFADVVGRLSARITRATLELGEPQMR